MTYPKIGKRVRMYSNWMDRIKYVPAGIFIWLGFRIDPAAAIEDYSHDVANTMLYWDQFEIKKSIERNEDYVPEDRLLNPDPVLMDMFWLISEYHRQCIIIKATKIYKKRIAQYQAGIVATLYVYKE